MADDTQAPAFINTLAKPIPAGCELLNGKLYRTDAKGKLVPDDLVKAQDKLQDETVRKIFGFAEELSAQITRFRDHTLADVADFVELLAQEYGIQKGGQKGNLTLTSFDGLQKVQVQVADRITFGPELQSAKALVDECVNDWTTGSRSEVRALIDNAFNVDKEGDVSPSRLFPLLRLDIQDERWGRAMGAIRDSLRVTGTKTYVRFYKRAAPDAAWVAVPIDVAAV